MSIVNIARNMKEVHPNYIILYRRGTFYYSYGKDAQIISYFFNYQIKSVEKNIPSCAFPKNSINKVKTKLEKEKINYLLIDVKNEYDIEEKSDNNNLSKYEEVFEKARKIINLRNRIYNIKDYLLDEINHKEINKKIIEIEKITYET